MREPRDRKISITCFLSYVVDRSYVIAREAMELVKGQRDEGGLSRKEKLSIVL